jgi:hypothetical protein
VELIFATIPLHLKTTVHVQNLDNNSQDISASYAETSLSRLRRALLMVLADLVLEHPDRKDARCPRVWMDDLMRVRKAGFEREDGGDHTVNNKRYSQSPLKLQNEKSSLIRRLAGTVEDRHYPWDFQRRSFYSYAISAPYGKEDQDFNDEENDKGYETLKTAAAYLDRFLKVHRHRPFNLRGEKPRKRDCLHLSCEACGCEPEKRLRGLRPYE